uniref:Uncharacterized protein n=1 Tax=Panagrolaimus davidi TaxID=227884 RepID=A0A914Q0E4_9BILA
MEKGGKEYYCVLGIQIVFAAVIAFFIAFKIHKKLFEMKNVLSAATLKSRKQFLILLILQLIVPSLFIVVPLLALLVSVLFDLKIMNALSNFMIPIMAFHSPANALTIIFVIPPYRQTLIRWIHKLMCIKHATLFKKMNSQNNSHLSSQIQQK